MEATRQLIPVSQVVVGDTLVTEVGEVTVTDLESYGFGVVSERGEAFDIVNEYDMVTVLR